MLTPKRNAYLERYYRGEIREFEAIKALKITRDQFRHLRHLFAKDELNRLWSQK